MEMPHFNKNQFNVNIIKLSMLTVNHSRSLLSNAARCCRMKRDLRAADDAGSTGRQAGEKMKKIVLVSMVKNEADIIESFVRHSLTYADELIIADHQSTDGTWEMLQKLRDEGLPLTLERLHRVEFALREVMNRLTREAVERHGADIVLPFDADEFLVNTENDISCRQVLEALDPERLYALRWRNYEPLDASSGRDRFLLARPCKRGRSWAQGQKTIVGGHGYVHGRPYELIQGSHFGEYVDDGSAVPMVLAPLIHTAHFHWRSPDQYASKVATSWLNNVTKYTVHTITASYLKGCFDTLRRHEPVVSHTLLKDAETLDLSPYVEAQTLRYTSPAPADIQGNIMAAAEQIAEQLAEMKVLQRKKRVSFILTWTGQDEAAWQKTLRSALSQTYPYRELCVLCFADGTPQGLDALDEDVARIPATAPGWAEALERRVQGDYVQWLLEGESITPDKVQKMVAFFETQDVNYTVAFAAGLGKALRPWWHVPLTEPAEAYHIRDIWQALLKQGRCPAGGWSAGLFHRTSMSAAGWLEDCFLDGRPMIFAMWYQVFRTMMQTTPGGGVVGILRTDFCDGPQALSADDFLWHQLQWATLLQASDCESDVLRAGWEAFIALGDQLKGQEKWTSSAFYPEVVRLLEDARRRIV